MEIYGQKFHSYIKVSVSFAVKKPVINLYFPKLSYHEALIL